MPNTIFIHASELITNSGTEKKQGIGIKEEDLGIISDGALVWNAKSGILWVGKTSELPKKYLKNSKKVDLTGKILSPALVDCHTHLVFAGSRHHEFAMKLKGASYQDIAKAGGGITYSVQKTREASSQSLFSQACSHVDNLIKLGVGILEIKSGYGLDWETEKKQLEVIQKVKKKYKNKVLIQSTFLGAHDFPKEADTADKKEAYVHLVTEKMLPEVAKKKLADACDVFFDIGYYNWSQSERILTKAKKLGLKVKVHADELSNTNGASLAAKLKALSADHLLKAELDGLKKMAENGVVAVLLPTTAFYLKIDYADMNKMREAKVCIALASDFNPGSSPSFHLPFVMSLACLQMKMTTAEAFAATTYGGAKALGVHDSHGFLKIGMKPKISIFNCPSYQALISQFAHPGLCWKQL